MDYSSYILKRKLENVFIFPFIVIGRIIAFITPLKKEFEIFFFFPFYHTGGAEKVHAQIANAIGNNNCIIYFTKKSVDQTFYESFIESGCIIKDISFYTDNKFQYFFNLIYRGIISGYINKQKIKPVVFNGQCNFGYKISPWIKKEIPQIELIHSYNSFSWIRIPFLPFITKTVMISNVKIENHFKQYDKIRIPASFKNKVIYISNGIKIPETEFKKTQNEKLQVLYVGRATPEKRVHIVAQIAKSAVDKGLRADFNFLGEVKNSIPSALHRYCNFIGTKTNENEINKIYKDSDIIIITSSTEGFPMVVMEAMAFGCAVLATPVGDLTLHIHSENGFLFNTVNDEKIIIEEAVNVLYGWNSNRKKLQQISETNILYAREHFDIKLFNEAYKKLIQSVKTIN